MPSLEQRNGRFRIVFRFAGQKLSRSLKTNDEDDAQGSFARLQDNLRRAELGHLFGQSRPLPRALPGAIRKAILALVGSQM
jgi:hypothetical protein